MLEIFHCQEKIEDLYTVKYTISPPSKYDVSLHMDWKNEIGNSFLKLLRIITRMSNSKKLLRHLGDRLI